MSPFARLPRALLTLLFLGACSGGDDSLNAPVVRSIDLLHAAAPDGEALASPGQLRRVVWIGGPTRLRLDWTGSGRVSVHRRSEGEEPATILNMALSKVDGVSVEFAYPPGPLELVFEAFDDVRWEEIVLEELAPAPPAPPAQPSALAGTLAGRDVVLILADSLCSAHLGAYGSDRPTSPTIDRLAAQGVRFASAYSQTSWTLSSVSTLFTSLEQERHGVLRMEDKLRKDFTTLAERFQEQGYRTAALVQNSVVAAHTQLDQGFERYEEFPYTPGDLDLLLTRARELLLDDRPRPMFLYLHLSPPHQPYRPPSPYLERFADPAYEGPVDGSVISCARLNQEKPPREDPDVRELEALYDSNVLYVDASIGRLLDELHAGGRDEHLLVVATADHGEAFFEHGVQGHNAQVYEEMVRIPLILWAPGSALASGTAPAAAVSLLDVYPTLVELCGLGDVPHEAGGTSLVPLFGAPAASFERPLFLSSRYRDDPSKVQRALRLGRHKLVMREGAAALYDLEQDPGETRDLSAELPLHAEALRERLEQWQAESLRASTAAPSAPLDEGVRSKIEALGYGGDDQDGD